ncbi:uncharacterized protein BXIN_2472 [Babesia sp. Xinjiang]|uniref:uncharacterized protein n=1 Tax=Babesia sp. Xinjiang TaxID=462227 RepID=UPI000A22C5FD|nr:uncharacterized protein BXIN_2472 [Babesia sp. Xinjiang]ORM41518.1 hypothetical protein BXIN_2472 [Babesia sp. Xinjiang]
MTDVPRIEAKKNEINALYREGRFSDAAQAYMRLVAEMLRNEQLVDDVKNLAATAKSASIGDDTVKQLLATLLSNAALCRFQERIIDEATELWEASLAIDKYNYKAAYHLVQCCIERKDFRDALKGVARCQNIAEATGMNKKLKVLPHAHLMERIGRAIDRDYGERTGLTGCDAIITAVEEGDAIEENLEKLNNQTRTEIVRQRVIPRLVKIICKNLDATKDPKFHTYILFTIHRLMQNLEQKIEVQLVSQLDEAIAAESFDLLRYAKELMAAIEKNPTLVEDLQSVAFHLARLCYVIGTSSALETICTIFERSSDSQELRVLSCVWQFFLRPRVSEKLPPDGRFITVLTRLLETILSHYDLEYDKEKLDLIERCLVPIFIMRHVRYEISEETICNIFKQLLEGYVKGGWLRQKKLQPQWYVIMKSLHLADKEFFKGYMIQNNALTLILDNYVNFQSLGPNLTKRRVLMSETIICCMDFLELRQQINSARLGDVSLVDHLRGDVEIAQFLTQITDRDDEIEKYCRGNNFSFTKEPKTDPELLLQEYKLLILTKLMVHSPTQAWEILEVFELTSLVPMALVAALIDGRRVDVLIDALSYLTLHMQAKQKEVVQLMYPVIRWADTSELCKGKTLYMVCQALANLTRSREHRHRFNRNDKTESKLDDEQLEAMRAVFEKLPAESRPMSNGEYDEGEEKLAESVRKHLLALHEDIPHMLLRILRRIMKDTGESTSTASQTLMLETLHYLTVPSVNRSKLYAAGVLRAFLNASSARTDKESRQVKYFAQSIAHLCLSADPKTLSYSDAQDASGPLVKLLGDENELLQYEAALGLTNLLSVDASVRKRVWSLGGWDALGNLVSSENAQLKAACLEGWCNFAASEGPVHDHFVNKLSEQFDALQPRFEEVDDEDEDEEDESRLKIEDAEGKDKVVIEEEAKEPLLEVHDINVMLLFAADASDLRCVKASTGALAYLAHDLRIAKYLPLCSKFPSLIKAADTIEDPEALKRVFTVFSCVMQGNLDEGSNVIRQRVTDIKRNIRECTKRNLPKIKICELTDLANDIEKYSNIADDLVA